MKSSNDKQKDAIERKELKETLVTSLVNKPLDQISVNPFISRPKFSPVDYLRIYGLGAVLAAIRTLPIIFCIVLSAVMASLFANSIKILDLMKVSTKQFKVFAKFIVYGILRIALFFAGFYWIKVTNRTKSHGPRPTILPIGPHTNFWDVVAMMKLGVPSIVSRYENSRIPLAGSIISLCDPVYVKREEKDSRMKAADDIKAKALVGNIMLFPEGTCTNTNSLIQFKLGAFLPGLPVQPVVIKWEDGKHDLRSWVGEGPGLPKLFYYTLSQFWTSCEIIILEPYVPNDEEKKDSRLFADNVEKVMCEELGVLQSFYSYDDVMFMGFANEIRIFRSPVCIKLLKVCYKILKEKSTQETTGSNLSRKIKPSKFAQIFNPTFLGLGEDFEHITTVKDFYIPKALLKMTQKKREMFKQKKKTTSDGKHLPMSGVVRNKFDASQTTPQIAITSDVANEKRLVYETFGYFVEKLINDIEVSPQFLNLKFTCLLFKGKGVIRPIESTKDLAKLLGLDETSTIMKSTSLMDLLKALEYRTLEGPTTLHLLVVLHLCDCREPNLWDRMKAAVNLLSLYIKEMKNGDKTENDSESEPKLDLQQFKTLLWYSMGVQQFDQKFLTQKKFNFEYIQKNVKTLFKRAVSENAQPLMD